MSEDFQDRSPDAKETQVVVNDGDELYSVRATSEQRHGVTVTIFEDEIEIDEGGTFTFGKDADGTVTSVERTESTD